MRFILCLIEQGLTSLLNIGLNIWLIRVGGGDLFGIYAFWFNVALLTGSVQFGLTICHLGPLPPGPGTMPQRIDAERVLLAASMALVAAAALIVGCVVLWHHGHDDIAATGAIALVPCFLTYQYARALAFSRNALKSATLSTTMVAAITTAGLAADHLLIGTEDANRVLFIAAAAYGVSGVVTSWWLARGLGVRLGHLRRYLPYAAISRWSVLGIVCFELMNRIPNFAVTGWYGAAALARQSTTQIPSRPPILLVASLQPALRNDLATLRSEGKWQRFGRATLRASVLAVLVNMLWALPVGLAWATIADKLFHGRFTDDVDLGLLWTASQGLGSLIVVLGTGFQVCGAFKRVGYADLAGAAATVAGLAVLMPLFGVAGTIGAMMLGQLAYLALVLIQWPRLQDSFPHTQPAATEPALQGE